jgi:hypothetical protein
VHDTFYFERRGIPAVFVASDVFRAAASSQSQALGMPDVARVFVPHPIQDATDAEMQAKAEAVVDEILAALESGAAKGEAERRRD